MRTVQRTHSSGLVRTSTGRAAALRKRRAADALAYNSLVESGPEFVRLAGDERADTVTQGTLASDEA